jgi:integrase
MASIRRRNGKWQVQVRRQGFPPLNRTFLNRRDAEGWARQQEGSLDRGFLPHDNRQLGSATVADLLIRYREFVTPKKRGAGVESYRIARLLRHPLSALPLSKASTTEFASYRDERLQQVGRDAVRKELALLRHMFEVARREWGLALAPNPLDQVAKPLPGPPRTVRVAPNEWERLVSALGRSRNPILGLALRFALETGIRRGELLRIEWAHIDLVRRVIVLPITKSGHPRAIPLSTDAMAVLTEARAITGDGVCAFPISANALRLAWERLRRRAGLDELRWHDLRHEAISRFFEKGLSVPEVAAISGHRDPRMLFRYTHPRPEEIARKLT